MNLYFDSELFITENNGSAAGWYIVQWQGEEDEVSTYM
jgi:hypothetical protein